MNYYIYKIIGPSPCSKHLVVKHEKLGKSFQIMYLVAIPDSFETSHVLFDISLSLENEKMNVNTICQIR